MIISNQPFFLADIVVVAHGMHGVGGVIVFIDHRQTSLFGLRASEKENLKFELAIILNFNRILELEFVLRKSELELETNSYFKK